VGTVHSLPYSRPCNIALRTAHIGVTGVLFGGHIFGIGIDQLRTWSYAAILTGVMLMILEAFPDWRYVLEGRGFMVLAKVLLLCLIPWFWDARVPLLVLVIILGSVGSHMPRRYRHFAPFGIHTAEKSG
jgi:hypothetical protein